jgi:hypothetical protein
MVGGTGVESCFCWSEAGMVIRVKCVGNGQCSTIVWLLSLQI